MITIKLYQCEICGTQYNNLPDAKACEKHHQWPTEVNPIRYNAKNNDGKYPQTVEVTFKDGSTVRYKK